MLVDALFDQEIEAISTLKATFDFENFNKLINAILQSKGKVVISGIGKSGLIAQKISASLCSIGISSLFLHSGDALHGDIGVISTQDIVIILSNSGEGRELPYIVEYCKKKNILISGVSQHISSYLLSNVNIPLVIPNTKNSNFLPTTSGTLMFIIGNLLVSILQQKIQLKRDEYLLYHPGGQIGLKSMLVKSLMLTNDAIPMIDLNTSMFEVALHIAIKKLGFTIVVHDSRIVGIITAHDMQKAKYNDHIKSLITNKYNIISTETRVEDLLNNNYDIFIMMDDNAIQGILTREILIASIQ